MDLTTIPYPEDYAYALALSFNALMKNYAIFPTDEKKNSFKFMEICSSVCPGPEAYYEAEEIEVPSGFFTALLLRYNEDYIVNESAYSKIMKYRINPFMDLFYSTPLDMELMTEDYKDHIIETFDTIPQTFEGRMNFVYEKIKEYYPILAISYGVLVPDSRTNTIVAHEPGQDYLTDEIEEITNALLTYIDQYSIYKSDGEFMIARHIPCMDFGYDYIADIIAMVEPADPEFLDLSQWVSDIDILKEGRALSIVDMLDLCLYDHTNTEEKMKKYIDTLVNTVLYLDGLGS